MGKSYFYDCLYSNWQASLFMSSKINRNCFSKDFPRFYPEHLLTYFLVLSCSHLVSHFNTDIMQKNWTDRVKKVAKEMLLWNGKWEIIWRVEIYKWCSPVCGKELCNKEVWAEGQGIIRGIFVGHCDTTWAKLCPSVSNKNSHYHKLLTQIFFLNSFSNTIRYEKNDNRHWKMMLPFLQILKLFGINQS